MKSNLLLNVIISIIIIALLAFFGYVVVVISLLMGGLTFYTPLIVVITVSFMILTVVLIFRLLKPKTIRIALISFFALCLIAISIYEIRERYERSIVTMSDQDYNLYGYQPFHVDTNVAVLHEPSQLKLEGDLPILDGATALYPVYSAFARAAYPEKEYDVHQSEVMSNQTGEAYQNLFRGDVDIIFVAAPSKRQLEQADQLGIELELTPIGREAFVFFVNEKNTVTSLTLEEVQGIYSGAITNWSDVGGENESIRAFQRPADSGSQTALEKLMGDVPITDPPTENVVSGMGGVFEEVSSYKNYKNALGYTFRFFATEMVQNGDIRYLEIEGVYPDKETIRNDTYPLASEFYAITAGSNNPNVERLLQWILSEQGQSLVEKTGYVPVREAE
ncbi:substrate-binding domain-containing protein [Alkalihalobacillus sp. MEB130]|uniref:PstS family phosphate ABC transporter substrate-binding protein n=1 Tax=Alkalihalobacillus sp. MEB130 TaxID=2976704 RepID=UPI0028DE5678|nr:substrate-binding domain-containing protein [Alkalihalobacillus sp. MEB130]MDT8858660.1 substrate-binding domain-containing protein [Alkalihalobacillus sp. MEB130]